MPQDGVLLDRGWKVQAGDNSKWASPNYDDSGWQAVGPTKDFKALPALWQHDVVRLRLHHCLDTALLQQLLVLYGQLVNLLGVISSDPEEVQAYTLPQGQMVPLPLGSGSEKVLAVQFTLQKDLPLFQYGGSENSALLMRVNGKVRQSVI